MRYPLLSALITCALAASTLADDVQFNRDIRPILSAHCYHCHGPDKNKREGDLRLDRQEGITDAFGGTD